MDTHPVRVVDAFTATPMAGIPVCVVLDTSDLSHAQRSAIAGEVGPSETAFVDDSTVSVISDHDQGRGIHVAIAVMSALREAGRIDDGTIELQMGDSETTATVGSAGRAWVDVPSPELRESAVSEDTAAAALGVDPATVRDVAADFPLARASQGRGYLVVPVNFLGSLSGATPDREAVAELLDETGAAGIYAITFDTLETDSDIHGQLVGPTGRSSWVTGEAAACAVAVARHHGATDRETVRVEEGDLLDRPARISVRADGDWQVGGRATTTLEGSVAVPPDESDDDIVVV